MLDDIMTANEVTVGELLRAGAWRAYLEDVGGSLATSAEGLQAAMVWLERRLEALQRHTAQEEGADRDVDRALARETLERYVPLADRMGLQVLRKRLEEASFRLLDPRLYVELARKEAQTQTEDEICLVVLQAGVRRLLDEHRIEGRVQGRIKGLYSLYHKMRHLNVPLGSILDRIGLRVIVPSVDDCYRVLALLEARFRPVPGTLDDYIAHPKANGYRSLHACFYPVSDLLYKPVEIQIRTLQMHDAAQSGPAAHWRYKHDEELGLEGEARLRWFRGLLEERAPAPEQAAFIQQLYRQVLSYGPEAWPEKGQAKRPPIRATVDDG